MDFEDAKRHNEFVRLDAAAVAMLLIITGIATGVLYDITFLLGFLSFAFMIVGFSVAWEWRNELAEQDMVESEPLLSVLSGSIFILLLQVAFALYSFQLSLIPSILYGIISASSYVFLVFFISFYDLPGEGYKSRYHPIKDDTTRYVFEEFYYIDLVEQDALSTDADYEQTAETTQSETSSN